LANIKSAEKRAAKAKEANRRNAAVKSGFRTLIKRFNELLTSDPAAARELLPTVTRALDRAAAKGVIHPNAAARKKSRLALSLNRGREARSAAGRE